MSDSNVQVVQEAYAAFQRGDVDGVLSRLNEDIDWQFYGPTELPTAGPRKGKAEVGRFFQQVGQLWNFERFEPRQFVSQGDVVIALGFYSGTAKGSGRSFHSEWAHVFSIKNGKCSQFREYADTYNLIQALGQTVRA